MRFMDRVNELCDALNTIGVPAEFVINSRNLLLTDGEDIDAWIDLAIELRKRQYYHACLLLYDTAMQCFPANKYILNNRGILLFNWGRLEEALQSFEQAIALDPTYINALEGRADTSLIMQNFLSAGEGYHEVLKYAPDRPQVWNKLGNCLKEIGQREDAKVAYEHAILLDPVYTEPLFNLASTLNEDRNFTKALEVVNRILTIDPDDRQAQQLRQEILLEPENPRKLKPDFVQSHRQVIRLSLGTYKEPGNAAPNNDNDRMLQFSEISKMSREEAAHVVGYKAWDLAHLTEVVNASIDEIPPPLSKPPSLFISYRWGDEGHNAWVRRFASDLEARGYDVILDRLVQERHIQAAGNPMPVPDVVGLLLKCTLFVPILTEPYRQRVELNAVTGIASRSPSTSTILEDGWVYDEFQIALHLSKIGRLKFMGIWRSAPVVPLPFRPDIVNDFRDDASYFQLMDKLFPPRMAIIVGFRHDGTEHMEGPIERIRIEEVGRVLQASGEFEYFGIIHL